ncbi:hypothetical protein ABZ860_03445 [Microbispora sp. NPDC046973]|uniref:hypothetical protein n=1 Tax=Microbispora sp. NPDC046973 TaxID=3155022 RepID=UPI0033ED219A
MRTYPKSLIAALAAAAAVAVASPASASASAVTISVEENYSQTVWEPDGVQFTCPIDQVLTGRSHYGDENKQTTYYCSSIWINGERVQVRVLDWSSAQRESSHVYIAPVGQALIGRWHQGDENGLTRYRPAELFWQGRLVQLTGAGWSSYYKESNHLSKAGYNQVMTGRIHQGDENGSTRYQYATVTVD